MTAASPARRGSYFFLSYAHSAPALDEVPVDTDHWVRVFHDDLTAAVRQVARPDVDAGAGLVDDLVRPGTDWGETLAGALGSAEVFVALYSPAYFKRAWPLRERTSFQRRLRHLRDGADRQRHLLPVLWSPLLTWERRTEIREALVIGEGVPGYADNGLRALCMLRSYEGQYREIVRRIAARIVEVAEHHPIGPSWAPAPRDVEDPAGAPAQLVVAVLARTADDAPHGRAGHVYGADAGQWRPFAEPQARPLADYVAITAERLGLPARTASLAVTQPAAATAVAAPAAAGGDSAAVLLVDPWVAADDGGAARIRAALSALPSWVVPVVVVDRRDPQFQVGAELAGRIAGLAGETVAPRVVEARDLRHFLEAVPVLVTEARRRHLRQAPVFIMEPERTAPAGAQRPWKRGDG
ncbi:TIR domain-containing protein [Dactylosporangium aurantiacum]|uniref:TIR domain-containing protein n=1 Tax=Dactylosporangium aurantiacum TaxID=35754 RepID=A0A9Q9IPE0_9ACTN|nr:TIR-like protein FxsC [Dactylosporangium aurantiacum]MDG6107966.1 TIR-like protein FxsC [Dactylosporangium aurantiacum]UWZ59206.1 TIR domain-containing protein [Dactylosporangium aurantiacum]